MKQLSLIEELERNNSMFAPLFLNQETTLPTNFSKNKDKGALYSDNPQFLDWIIYTNPMTLVDVKLKKAFTERLPVYIPNVDLSDGSLMENFQGEVVSVSVASILKKLKSKREFSNIHEILKIKPTVKILARFFDKDASLEKVSAEGVKLFDRLAKLDVGIFTSPNFSVVLKYPISDQVVNVKRSLICAQQLSERGVSVIPHIFWAGNLHMKMLVDWINNPKNNAKTIIIDLGEGGKRFFSKTLADLIVLKNSLDPEIQLIISGPGTYDKISKLKLALGNFTLIESTAARFSKLGLELVLENKKILKKKSFVNKSEIFTKNIALFNNLLSMPEFLLNRQKTSFVSSEHSVLAGLN